MNRNGIGNGRGKAKGQGGTRSLYCPDCIPIDHRRVIIKQEMIFPGFYCIGSDLTSDPRAFDKEENGGGGTICSTLCKGVT